MAITTQDGLVAAMAASQQCIYNRNGARTTVSGGWFTSFDLAGNPGAGTLAGTSTANGVVPTDATAGFPPINAFSGANSGYLTGIHFGSSVACRIRLLDMLFKAGAYAFNANQALSSQPSYSGRCPGGSFVGLELWAECTAAFTGNPTFTITYTNQAGTTGRTATLAAGLAPTVGRMLQIPLQAGDTGIQKIDNVACSVATVGQFNILVLRPIWSGRVGSNSAGGSHGPDMTDLWPVFSDSALFSMIATDSTAIGIHELLFSISNG